MQGPSRLLAALLLGAALAAALPGCTAPRAGGPVREFRVVARQFAFDPAEIRVRQGDRVRLLITSVDVTHGLAIREFGVNRQVPAGQEVAVEFVAERPGTYVLFCTVFCGTAHAEHKSRLVVEP